jgi:hypothetical protein
MSNILLLKPMLLGSLTVHGAAAASSNAGLTAAGATIIAAACSAIAVLAVGILNVATQRRQLNKQEQQSNRQLNEQRNLLERQLDAQREQSRQQHGAQREQFDRQLAEQRTLRAGELEVETAKTIRAEKKAAYVKMLSGCRNTQAIWELIAYQHPQSLLVNLESVTVKLAQDQDDMRTGLAEIELLGSHDVAELVDEYTKRTGGLLAKFIQTSEAAIQRSGGQPTLGTLAESQKAVREEISRSDIPQIFSDMREMMREEIGGHRG